MNDVICLDSQHLQIGLIGWLYKHKHASLQNSSNMQNVFTSLEMSALLKNVNVNDIFTWICALKKVTNISKTNYSLQIRGERILCFRPNTNTNNIRNQNFDRIRIRIIFVFSEWANTNTNNIRAQIFGRIRIRIIFGIRIVPEYEYE